MLYKGLYVMKLNNLEYTVKLVLHDPAYFSYALYQLTINLLFSKLYSNSLRIHLLFFFLADEPNSSDELVIVSICFSSLEALKFLFLFDFSELMIRINTYFSSLPSAYCHINKRLDKSQNESKSLIVR